MFHADTSSLPQCANWQQYYNQAQVTCAARCAAAFLNVGIKCSDNEFKNSPCSNFSFYVESYVGNYTSTNLNLICVHKYNYVVVLRELSKLTVKVLLLSEYGVNGPKRRHVSFIPRAVSQTLAHTGIDYRDRFQATSRLAIIWGRTKHQGNRLRKLCCCICSRADEHNGA